MAAEDEPVYCLCRLSYDDSRFMIECDVCNDWFHGNCVGVQEHQASDIEIYHCPNCQKEHGPLTLKKRRNWHRHDYSETDSSKAVQTGTVTFIKELKNRNFPSADEIPILRVKGSDLTLPHFEENGFDVPILVENKEGLEIQVPPADFSIQDIENHVGSMREIDVIDVARQEDYKMLMREWTEYYNSPDRDKIFNVISLEFSNTKLSDLVVPPKIVRQVSWVNNMWPDNLPDDCTYSRPEVQKYCLMGVQDSFTDFHIDFGGTSVWYHVLRGEKVFYLIRPTPANMDLYEGWISSSNQSETFFGDQVDSCYKSVVTAGQTLFIPTGWIHAVFTPVDTLVFGGNFLHTYNVPLQLKVYEIERHVKTPEKYLFPSFETICWYAAKYVLDILKDCEEDGRKASNYVISGAKSLAQHLKSWTQRKDLNSQYIFAKSAKHDVPEHIQYGKLLKELVKVSRNFEVQAALKPKVERKRRKKNIPTPKQMESLDILHQHTTEKLQELQKQEHKNEEQKNVYAFPDDPPSPPPTSLKMRIPKAGAFIDNVLKTVKEEEENLNPSDISSLKLKVSNGRIVGDNVKPEVVNLGKFQPLMTDFDDDGGDSDPDQLVVDESPAVRKKSKPGENNSRTTMKPGSLKLKLSFSGKYPNESEGQEAPEGAPTAKRQRKTPAAKKEKKPAATTTPTTAGGPKAKGGGPKATAAAAGKKETKKAPARATKGKGKQNKDQQIDNQTCVETPDASSGLTVPTPELLNSLLSGEPLTLKVKGDYSLLGSQPDTFLPLEQAGLTTEPPKNEPKGKKQKGEPKGKRGATKKAKAEALLLAKEEPGGTETKVATAVKETPNRKTKAKDTAAAKAATLLDGKTEAGTPLDLPFLETRFEPLLEIKSEAPAKKGKGESKRGRGGGAGAAAKKKEEGAKGRGNSKKGAAAAVAATDGSDGAAKSQDSTTSPDDFYEDPLVINLQDTKPKKGGRGKAAPKRAKANKAAADSADDGGTPGKKAKTEAAVASGGGGKKSKNVPAGNKGKTEPPLLVNLKKDPQSEKPANQPHRNVPPTSNQTDSSKMAWSDLPSMSSPPPQQQHERKHLTSPQPDLQSLMAIRANLQSLTSPRSDSQQTFIRQDSPSLKQGSPLKSPHSDPFSCLSKKSGGSALSSTSSSLTLSPSLSTSAASSSKHFTQKKTDSITSASLSSLSKKSDSLFLLPKKPDPLSLVPKKPDPLSLIPPKKQDPLSLIPKKRDPLSLLPPKPDPLSLKLTQSDSSLLSLKNPDTTHNNNNNSSSNTNATANTTTTTNNNSNSNNNKHPLSLLHSNNKTNNKSNNKKSGLEGKPDPLSEAFLKNKEPLTPKDNSSLMSGPKSELASSKKTKTSTDSTTTTTAAMKSMTTTTTTNNTTTTTTTALTTTCDKLTVCDDVTSNDGGGGEKKESVSQMAVDIKLDQLASILKSESLLSKARLSTLKPVEGPVTPGKQDPTKDKVKDKQADNGAAAAAPAVTAGSTAAAAVVGSQTKAAEKLLPTKEKVPSSPVGKLKQSAEHTSRKKASTNPVSSAGPTTPTTTTPTTKSKPEKILSLRAELHAKQLAMQAKIAEEEGGGAGGKSVTETEQSKRMNMPTIRGGLNCGIADILEASGYGTETDFQVDEDVSAPSPTMRDAIQGMLSMSRMGSPQLFSGGAALAGGKGRKQWSGPHAEEEEQLGVCYKDDEYIYPSLDISDDEDSHIFKPRGRQKKDETWNPKARVMVTSEKRERMARDNARRESMENTLAVTAAKYETMAKSKSGNRKRLKPEELVEEMSAAPKSPNLTVSQDSAPGNPAAATPTSSKLGGTPSLAVLSSPTVATAENGSSVTPQPSTSSSSSSTPSKGGVSTTISAATPSTSEAVASTSAGAPRPSQPPFSSPQSCPSKPKKPKKGFATAKQRLGRILKIHKMRF